MAFRFAFKRSRRDSVEGLIGRESLFNPFAPLPPPHPASGLIVLRRINYHLLSAAAEARTKREAPVFWKRNLAGSEVRDTHRPPWCRGVQYAPGVCTATPPTMAAAARRRRRDAAKLTFTGDWFRWDFSVSENMSQKDPERDTKFGLNLTYIACFKRSTQIFVLI